MAYRAGIKTCFLDSTQFHPTGAIYPEQNAGLLITEKVRGLGAHLLNRDGEEFLFALEPRDVASACIIRECGELGKGIATPAGRAGVWLDSPMIDLLQPAVQAGWPVLDCVGFQLTPQDRIGRAHRRGPALQDGRDVLAGATHQHRQLAPAVDLLDGLQGCSPVVGQAPDLLRIGHVDEVMGNPAPQFRRGLGRSDVHAAVEQAGVGGDDLGPDLFGQFHRAEGLPDTRGADQGHQRRKSHRPPCTASS